MKQKKPLIRSLTAKRGVDHQNKDELDDYIKVGTIVYEEANSKHVRRWNHTSSDTPAGSFDKVAGKNTPCSKRIKKN